MRTILRNLSARRWRCLWFVVLWAAVGPRDAVGQYELSGAILADGSRGVLRGATVVVIDAAGRRSQAVLSDSAGRFRLRVLPSGSFLVQVTLAGYDTLTSPPLTAEVAQSGPVELLLRRRSASRAGVIHGTVFDSSRRRIPFVQIRVGSNDWRIADDSGRFQVSVHGPGPIAIESRRVGFQPVQFTLDVVPDTTITVIMHPLAAAMETVRIEAERTVRSLELGGFYRRARDRASGGGSGVFVTPEEIEKRVVTRPTQYFDGIPGVRVLPSGRFPPQYVLAGNTPCLMTVYVNGMRLNGLGDNAPPPYLDQAISPTHVAGIEVYSRSNAPTEFQALGGTCGVVLVWSK